MKFPDLSGTFGPIPWAVIGAAATRHYMPERLTNDLDILVSESDLEKVENSLAQSGAKRIGNLSIGGSQWTLADGFQLDVVSSGEEWVGRALAEASTNRDLQGLPVIPLPWLVLLKFRASRLQDVADISRMLGGADEGAVSSVREVFKQWLPSEIEDLESLINLGRLEYGS